MVASTDSAKIISSPKYFGLTGFDACLMLILLMAIVSSALAVSYVSQSNRHLFNELELLRKESISLHSRWSRLLLERSTLASNVRIESIAKKDLGLRLSSPADTVIVK